MSIQTAHNVNGWIATDQDTGISALASFKEGEKQAIKNCKAAVKDYTGADTADDVQDSTDEKG